MGKYGADCRKMRSFVWFCTVQCKLVRRFWKVSFLKSNVLYKIIIRDLWRNALVSLWPLSAPLSCSHPWLQPEIVRPELRTSPQLPESRLLCTKLRRRDPARHWHSRRVLFCVSSCSSARRRRPFEMTIEWKYELWRGNKAQGGPGSTASLGPQFSPSYLASLPSLLQARRRDPSQMVLIDSPTAALHRRPNLSFALFFFVLLSGVIATSPFIAIRLALPSAASGDDHPFLTTSLLPIYITSIPGPLQQHILFSFMLHHTPSLPVLFLYRFPSPDASALLFRVDNSCIPIASYHLFSELPVFF
jgi:hypothetical protein